LVKAEAKQTRELGKIVGEQIFLGVFWFLGQGDDGGRVEKLTKEELQVSLLKNENTGLSRGEAYKGGLMKEKMKIQSPSGHAEETKGRNCDHLGCAFVRVGTDRRGQLVPSRKTNSCKRFL